MNIKSMRMPLLLGSLVMVGALAGAAPKTMGHMKNMQHNMSSMDRSFAQKAAMGGLAEVKLASLAETHASSGAVKEFAGRMVTDHTKANNELMEWGRRRSFSMPSAPASTEKKLYNSLSKLRGAAFDRAYMNSMVKDHTMDVAEFTKASQKCSNPELREWAGKKLPVLREHLTMARSTYAGTNTGHRK